MAALDATGRPAPALARTVAATSAHAPWIAQAVVPFALVLYLGLNDGGYDEVVRGDVGILAWAVLLLGAAAGALPLRPLGRRAWAALALLAALTAWTGAAMIWSESAGRTSGELARLASLLGILAFALSVQGRPALRRAVAGVGAAIAVLAGVAVLSRLEPTWFDQPEPLVSAPESRARLQYPVGYWNGLAALCGMGVPLLLALASAAQWRVARVLALAAIPVLALAAFFTLSRGGAVAGVLGAAILLALHPRRLALAGRAALAGAGAAILVIAADARPALVDGLSNANARAQGDELLFLTLAVCAAVALAGLALEHVAWRPRAPSFRVPRRARPTALLLAAAVVAVALAAGGGAAAADAWREFKEPEVPRAESGRFESAGGSGRYQFWSAATDAAGDRPLLGTGPGTYEFVWARDGELDIHVSTAHSLLFETLAELGVPGLVLVLALLAAPLTLLPRALRLPDRRRVMLAAALGACAAFAFAAATDWVWELTVLPAAFLLLGAAALGGPQRGGAGIGARPGRQRAALAALALLALPAVAIPTAGAVKLDDSRAAARAGELDAALDDARAAADLQPWAADARLQEALVLEQLGEDDAALAAGLEAAEREHTNWLVWLTLARLARAAGDAELAAAAERSARTLSRDLAFLPGAS